MFIHQLLFSQFRLNLFIINSFLFFFLRLKLRLKVIEKVELLLIYLFYIILLRNLLLVLIVLDLPEIVFRQVLILLSQLGHEFLIIFNASETKIKKIYLIIILLRYNFFAFFINYLQLSLRQI